MFGGHREAPATSRRLPTHGMGAGPRLSLEAGDPPPGASSATPEGGALPVPGLGPPLSRRYPRGLRAPLALAFPLHRRPRPRVWRSGRGRSRLPMSQIGPKPSVVNSHMVHDVGVEPTTLGIQSRCSTIELVAREKLKGIEPPSSGSLRRSTTELHLRSERQRNTPPQSGARQPGSQRARTRGVLQPASSTNRMGRNYCARRK